MNELKKTLIFCVVAAGLMGAAFALRPSTESGSTVAKTGAALFENFTDPTKVTTLEIVKASDKLKAAGSVLSLGGVEKLQLVKQPNDTWIVASHQNYPAGVMDRVAESAAMLSSVKIGGVISETANDHERFGVVDPLDKDVDFATGGVGMHVTVKEGEKTLADVIVGNPVNEGNLDVRYVRAKGDDVVYQATLKDFPRLSTRFDEWIETRVLEVPSSSDIRRVVLRDYTFSPDSRIVEPRHRIDVAYDGEKFQWKVNDIGKWKKPESILTVQEKPSDFEPANLKPEEELNSQALNDLTWGLSDLKVVDVKRKPDALVKRINRDTGEIDIKDYQAGELNPLGLGFFVARAPDDPRGITFAYGGDLMFQTKDGFEYYVRFGDEAGLDDGSKKTTDVVKKEEGKKDDAKKEIGKDDTKAEDAKKDGEAKPGEKKDAKEGEGSPKVNRYMFRGR